MSNIGLRHARAVNEEAAAGGVAGRKEDGQREEGREGSRNCKHRRTATEEEEDGAVGPKGKRILGVHQDSSRGPKGEFEWLAVWLLS